MFAINGFALYLDSVFTDYTLTNPFTNSTISFPTQPDPRGTLGDINQTSSTNATGGVTVYLWDAANYAWNSTIFIVNLLTGGFIFQVLAAFVPASGSTVLVYGIFQSVIGFWLILTVLHFWRGIL